MFMSGAYDLTGSPAPRPSCATGRNCSFLLYQAMATSAAHAALARRMAAEATVLLKNGNTSGAVALPIRRGARVALLGGGCAAPFIDTTNNQWDAADYYTIGGSGNVKTSAEQHSTVEDGLKAAESASGIELRVSRSEDVWGSIEAMRGHDVAVVCGGASRSMSLRRWPAAHASAPL